MKNAIEQQMKRLQEELLAGLRRKVWLHSHRILPWLIKMVSLGHLAGMHTCLKKSLHSQTASTPQGCWAWPRRLLTMYRHGFWG